MTEMDVNSKTDTKNQRTRNGSARMGGGMGEWKDARYEPYRQKSSLPSSLTYPSSNQTKPTNMPLQPPTITTYHCLCTSLLLASTHTFSSLPRRSTGTGALDSAIILPLPSAPTSSLEDANANENTNTIVNEMPVEGYTIILGMIKATKPTVVRREDGFEKRMLWRCVRCGVVVGYEILGQGLGLGMGGGEKMDLDVDGGEKGKGKGKEGYEGRIMYVLPGGATSTDVMRTGRKVGEGDVDIQAGTVAAFE
ncbi:hypothetical protein LHYA1_G008663 [Lachnellula hyalina]|uniref:STEEP1 domain-containing protein n=1 Tax=Lachnellula hyalina TaxID=1316788 RepID=A0A8H8TV08_9HELO|nr:uncharacterized protein LHYA1_G008663 [Lachnellula hyalina]TVY22842.1 hypothetical protein LHYA1_G008663 [Lachnellula hyalina]